MLRASIAVLLFAASLAAQEFVGFRYNSDHVVVFIGLVDDPPPTDPDSIPDPATQWETGGLQRILLQKVSSGALPPDNREHSLQIGDVYEVNLTGDTTVEAEVDELVFRAGGASMWVGGLARVRSVDQSTFESACKAGLDAYVARPLTFSRPHHRGPVRPQIRDLQLSPEAAHSLQAALSSVMQRELARMGDLPSPYADNLTPEQQALWKQRDAVLSAGRAKFVCKVQAVNLGGSFGRRNFVRALWTVEGAPAFFLSAWFVPGTSNLEAVDVSTSAWMRGRLVTDEPPDFESSDVLVNVFEGGEILQFSRGYESFGLELLQFYPNGLHDTGVGYGDGA